MRLQISIEVVSQMKYTHRPECIQRLLDLMGTPDIRIITGVRRSGKSELMKAYIRRITETQPNANIIFVDFFDLKYDCKCIERKNLPACSPAGLSD